MDDVVAENQRWLLMEQQIRSGTRVRAKSLEVSCPTCREGPGAECRDLRRGQETRRVLVPHYPRLAAAYKELEAEDAAG